MPSTPSKEDAEVIIALGSAFTLFALVLITAVDPDLVLKKETAYMLLSVIGTMLGINALTG